jgi:hypothetical protein
MIERGRRSGSRCGRRVLHSTAAALLLLAAPAARAGPRPYAFTQGVDSLPETQLELETWYGAQRPRGGTAAWDWWLGPVVGITDRLEGGLFGIFDQGGSGSPALVLSSLRLQVSGLLADKGAWPVDVKVRGEVGIPAASGAATLWLSAVASRDLGRLNLTLDVGGWGEMERKPELYLTTALGTSYELVGGLRAGAEVFGDVDLRESEARYFAGPALAFGRGRLWISSAVGFGLAGERASRRGRIVVGIAL